MKIIISLTKEDKELLLKEIKGQGGWQNFMKTLLTKIKGNKVELELEDVLRIIRYSKGQGGFQTRLGSLYDKIMELERAILNESKE